MKKFGLLSLIALFELALTACTLLPSMPSTDRISQSKVEHPFFNIPPMNLKDYQERTWILLAESTNNNWFYDPYSLVEDDERVVKFDVFITQRSAPSSLDRFNASSIGPFSQKIDCFGNYQWSETFYADKMPAQETFINSHNPNLEYGWIKIKPKSAMAYIRTRICGRKFLDDKNINYFLFQEGYMKDPPIKPFTDGVKGSLGAGELMLPETAKASQSTALENPPNLPVQNPSKFYEVVNNAFTVVDTTKDIREMRVASYVLDKEFPRISDYVYRASCQAKTYSFSMEGKFAPLQDLTESPESLVNVAFNRICGEHGNYMKLASPKGK